MRTIVLLFLCIDVISAQQDTIIKIPNSYFVFTKENDSLYKKKRFNSDSILIENGYSKSIDINGRYNVCKFYYDSGELKMVGSFNYKKQPNGLFKYYYLNGNIAKVDSFVQGNKKGEAINYYENGQVESKGNYNTLLWEGSSVESKIGKWVYYYENGNKKAEGCFYFKKVLFKEDLFENPSKYVEDVPVYYSWKKDVKHGKWRYWGETGNLVLIEKYRLGKLIKSKKIVKEKGVHPVCRECNERKE